MASRVLQIIADGMPSGGTTMVLGLSEDLSRSGQWDVSLISRPNSYALQAGERLQLSTYGFEFFTSRLDLRLASRLRPLINRIKPDVIHVHGPRAALPFCFGPLCELGCPVAYTVHGYQFLNKPALVKPFAIFAEAKIAKSVDHIFFISRADTTVAAQRRITGGDSATWSLIYNGINPEDFEGIEPLGRQYDLIFIGRMHVQKNPLFMLDVMKHLQGSGTTLLMVGGGELEGAVRSRAFELGLEGAITFLGAVSREETLRAIRSAKVHVFPSLWEGLPIAPMESQYCGLPVVASKIAGTDEVVVDGITGVLIDKFDAARYAKEILNLLRCPKTRRRLADAGRASVMRRFIRQAGSRAYANQYRKLTGSRAGTLNGR